MDSQIGDDLKKLREELQDFDRYIRMFAAILEGTFDRLCSSPDATRDERRSAVGASIGHSVFSKLLEPKPEGISWKSFLTWKIGSVGDHLRGLSDFDRNYTNYFDTKDKQEILKKLYDCFRLKHTLEDLPSEAVEKMMLGENG